MIRIEGLHLRRGGFALQGIDWLVETGRYALVIGPTGAGKSTLLELIAGHVLPDAGAVGIDGIDVTHLPPEARGVGVVYQQHHLFPHLSVQQNIGYGLPQGHADRQVTTNRVRQVAETLAIEHLLERSVGTLSGGERQRVALARALAPRPKVLILDEPLASLDASTRRQLREVLRRIHRAEATTMVHVTHDFEDALRLGDLVAVLHQGRMVQTGRPVDVFQTPATPFVADFVGSGNVLAGQVEADGRDRTVFRSGPLQLEVVTDRRGTCHALIRPEEILVTRTLPPTPPRNHLRGRISRIEVTGALAAVTLDVGLPLTAYLTRTSIEELALAPNDPVSVAIKATAVHIM